jgi:hypothetical protein
MTREEAAKTLTELWGVDYRYCLGTIGVEAVDMAIEALKEPKWILCSERLPEDLEPVNITWVNHNPESYYADIKDKPFTATGHYCNGRWWWFSETCQDYLGEYGRCDVHAMDDDIEVIAWMPLPEPYERREKK